MNKNSFNERVSSPLKTGIGVAGNPNDIELTENERCCGLSEIFVQSFNTGLEILWSVSDIFCPIKIPFISDFLSSKNISDEENLRMKEFAKNLKQNFTSSTLKQTILSLNTSDKNIAAIYKRYREMKNVCEYTEEYNKIKNYSEVRFVDTQL